MLRKLKSNKASSALISFILIVPLFLGIVVTIFDTTIYFSNRSAVLASAQEGARYAAIVGGPGSASLQTTIERSYGQSSNACNSVRGDRGNNYFGVTKSLSGAECVVLKNLYDNSSLTLASIENVTCFVTTPAGATAAFTSTIGDTVVCEVSYTYAGLPGAPLHWISNGNGDGLMEKVVVSATSNAEVGNAPRTLRR